MKRNEFQEEREDVVCIAAVVKATECFHVHLESLPAPLTPSPSSHKHPLSK